VGLNGEGVIPGAAERRASMGHAAEALLTSLPSEVGDIIRLGAIPNWFDRKLLARLCGRELDAVQAMPYLDRLRFVRKDTQGRFRYHGEVRDYLLAWWKARQRDRHYVVANQHALAYFSALAEAATEVERPVYEREVLYHLLIVDESVGLGYLSARFETACGRHQLSLAEAFVARAAELGDILSDEGRMWLQYFQARLDLIHRQGDAGESVFQDLAERAPASVLRALALASLGEILVKRQQWSRAITLYRTSLAWLQQDRAPIYDARIMLAIGDAYRDLADSCGGFLVESDRSLDSANRLLYSLQYLPFLIYEELVHRVSFFPNWYFGTCYQDWVLAYLRMEAVRWYRRAEKQLQDVGDRQYLAEAQLSLADLEYQLGRWSRARRRYQRLLDTDEIKGSHYRTARVRLGQGQSLLDQERLSEAEVALSEALQGFRRFEDHGSIGIAAALLGRLYAVQDRPTQAASIYVESAQAFGAAGAQLARTQVIWALEGLGKSTMLPHEQQQQVEAAISQVSERHYISRFPERLLEWFRRLAVWGALPLTYALTFVLGLGLTTSIWIIEGLFVTGLSGVRAAKTTLDFLILIAAATLPVVLALWIYRLIYTFMGAIVVHFLGRRLIPIEQEQPCYYATDAAGLVQYDASRGSTDRVAWSDISLCASVDYFQHQVRIPLISSTVLARGSSPIAVVGGITAGYSHLKQDIARHLDQQPDSPVQQNLDFRILHRPWIAISILISLALALYAVITGGFSIGAGDQSTDVSRVLLSSFILPFIVTMLLVFPAVTLWRLIHHRRILLNRLGYRIKAMPSWLLWPAAILCTIVTVLWILMLLST
jgi:tetratricopeptide (TPR) repeat protein